MDNTGHPAAAMTARAQHRRIEVRVADRGRGFDPALVPPRRRGLSEPIAARMAAAGTEVTWRWSHG